MMRPTVRLLFPAVLCALASVRSAAQQPALPDATEMTQRVDEVAARYLQRATTVGLSIGVAHGGELRLAKGYGRAELEFDTAAGPATMFRIGSVTKQFTAALVMRCVENGKLSLDDALSRFVPASEFPTGDHVVTIRQLLNHTSGIPSYTDIGVEWEKTQPLELSHQELLAMVAGKPFNFAPGQGWNYNNTGYYLLGMVLERVFEKPYAQVVVDELAQPIGLERTRYDSNVELLRDRAQGYQWLDGALANDAPLGVSHPGAAGALLSTGGELVRWSMALSGGKVVSPESFAAMMTPTVLPDGRETGYGFALMTGTIAGRRCIQHGGGIHGFVSLLVWLPDEDLHLAVISNSERLSPPRFAADLVRSLLGDRKVDDREVDAELGARLAGAYEITQLEMATAVTFAEGKMMLQAEGQDAFRLQWQGGLEFVAEFDVDVRLAFAADAQSFTLHQAGGVFQGKRVIKK